MEVSDKTCNRGHKEYKVVSDREICIECRRINWRKWWLKNKDADNKRVRDSYIKNRERRLKKHSDYMKTDRGKEAQKEALAMYHKKNPEKKLAHQRFNSAVASGRVQVLPCEECGEKKVEGHHYLGYAEEHWYDVKWLCRKHHRDAHKFSLSSRGLL